MFTHIALDKQRGHRRVDADGQQQLGEFGRGGPQNGGILRHGQGVQVDDAEHRVGPVLVVHPGAKRSEQIAKLHWTRWFDAGKDPCHNR